MTELKLTKVGKTFIRVLKLPGSVMCNCSDGCDGLWYRMQVMGGKHRDFHTLDEALAAHTTEVLVRKVTE